MLYVLVARVAIRPHRFLPIDRAGNLAPASLWEEIDQMLLDSAMPADQGGGN